MSERHVKIDGGGGQCHNFTVYAISRRGKLTPREAGFTSSGMMRSTNGKRAFVCVEGKIGS